MKPFTFSNASLICSLVCLPLLGVIGACVQKGPGTSVQSAEARAAMNNGIAKIRTVRSDITALLGKYRGTPPAQLLIPTAAKVPPVPVAEIDLAPHYGTYTETAAGQFSFAASALEQVDVHYLNGINLTFGFFAYNQAGNLSLVRTTFSSDNRGIDTPKAEEIRGYISQAYNDYRDDIAGLDSFDYKMASLVGLTFTNSAGTTATLSFEYFDAVTTNSTPPGVTTQVKKVERVANAALLATDFWDLRVDKTYRSTAIPGVHAAISVDRKYTDSLKGNKVDYNAPIVLLSDGLNLGASGQVEYVPYRTGLVHYTLEGKTYRVATLAGGGYKCDLNLPNRAGFGDDIFFSWSAPEVEPVMPGHFDCPNLIIAP